MPTRPRLTVRAQVARRALVLTAGPTAVRRREFFAKFRCKPLVGYERPLAHADSRKAAAIPLAQEIADRRNAVTLLVHNNTHSKPIHMLNTVPTQTARGFTLIEVMIIVVVLGILSAIAIPNYSRYVTRGQLVEATNALSEYRVRMEQFFQDNRTYSNAGNCGAALPVNLTNFAVTCAIAAGGQAYTATATGAAATAGFVYTINQANARATTALPAHWGDLPADAGTRWVTR